MSLVALENTYQQLTFGGVQERDKPSLDENDM